MQTIEAGSTAAIIVNVTDENGDHVAASINSSTTRIQKGNAADTTWDSAAPSTIDTITTGVYRIVFTGLSPELQLSHNDDGVRLKINGTISGVAWTEYHMPLRVVPATPRQVLKGIVETGGGATAPTTTAFTTEWTASKNVVGRTLVFTSGTLVDQAVKITGIALDGSNYRLTVETESGGAMGSAPSDADTFLVV